MLVAEALSHNNTKPNLDVDFRQMSAGIIVTQNVILGAYMLPHDLGPEVMAYRPWDMPYRTNMI